MVSGSVVAWLQKIAIAMAECANIGGTVWCESLQVPDCPGVRWQREVVGLNCTVCTKYKEHVMSRTTANIGR